MEHLPFNLEVALKNPERVTTKNGKKITEIHYFKATHSQHSIGVVFCNELHTYTTNGSFIDDKTSHPFDLFLLPDYKEKFVNVYLSVHGELYIGNALHDTLLEAKQIAKLSVKSTYLKTIKITSLPYEPDNTKKEAMQGM